MRGYAAQRDIYISLADIKARRVARCEAMPPSAISISVSLI